MLKNILLTTHFFALSLLLAAGCVPEQPRDQNEEESQTGFTTAVAVVHPTEGNEAAGTVWFEQVEGGVRVTAELTGLDSNSRHGFHIHEYGDCTAGDGTSAGGHYNPAGADHGGPTHENRHMGDMGNLVTDEDGNATLEYVDPVIELNGPNSIIGRGLIVHGGEDDLQSQPTGDAGPRLACGVIGVANTE